MFKYGHEHLTETNTLHGGLSEYTILRANTPVVRLRGDMPVKVAAVINCAVATAAGACRLAGDLRDKNVLISGAGMLGIVACAMAKTAGARHVIAVDTNAARLQTARQFGADMCFDAASDYLQGCNQVVKYAGRSITPTTHCGPGGYTCVH